MKNEQEINERIKMILNTTIKERRDCEYRIVQARLRELSWVLNTRLELQNED